jgi:hypothetical protein
MPNVIEFGAAAGASAVAVFLGLAFGRKSNIRRRRASPLCRSRFSSPAP